ncbi:MAG: hypothetical protein M3O22_07385 [Pseudomonadota bacterium]|nr:hypothetical protein [Pseudomonadota bacterium]
MPAVPEKFPKVWPKRYNWELAADLLAKGFTATEVARKPGCHRRSVFFALKRSPALRFLADKLDLTRADYTLLRDGAARPDQK